MIDIRDICVSFGEKRVLEQVSLSLAPGERVCLSAPSGSGKTTLAKVILGLLRPDSGEVNVNGKAVAVFQEDRLLPHMNVLQNVTVGQGGSRTLAAEILTALGLGDVLHARPAALSGGMRRRVALARALWAHSAVIVLDEPFNGLDAAAKTAAIDAINTYAAAKTLVLISHDPNEAQALNARTVEIGNR